MRRREQAQPQIRSAAGMLSAPCFTAGAAFAAARHECGSRGGGKNGGRQLQRGIGGVLPQLLPLQRLGHPAAERPVR